jgi:hypothetical protein
MALYEDALHSCASVQVSKVQQQAMMWLATNALIFRRNRDMINTPAPPATITWQVMSYILLTLSNSSSQA